MSTQTRGPTRVRSGLAILMAGALVGAAADSVYAVQYTFTPVAELGGTYTGIGLGLGSINNDGTVAYVGTSADGIQRVLKTSMDGTTTVIADTTGPLKSFYLSDSIGTTPAINDHGVVGFVAVADAGGTSIFTGNGGEIRFVGQTSNSSWVGSRPYLNSTGQVMYSRRLPSGTGVETVVDTAGDLAIIATDSAANHVVPFGINSAGEVLTLQSPSATWVIGDGSADQVIGTVPPGTAPRGAISDYHAVFTGANPTGGESIYAYRNGFLSTIVDTNADVPFFYGVATNNVGQVVFIGGGSIFSTADLSTPIVSVGSTLLGSTLTSFMMFPSLNDAGQFAFYGTLADSRTLLVRVDPVPEPAGPSLLLLASGMLCICGRRCRLPA